MPNHAVSEIDAFIFGRKGLAVTEHPFHDKVDSETEEGDKRAGWIALRKCC